MEEFPRHAGPASHTYKRNEKQLVSSKNNANSIMFIT